MKEKKVIKFQPKSKPIGKGKMSHPTQKQKAEREEQKRRVAVLHEQLITSLFEKVPILKEKADTTYLQKHMFEKLTDQEFVVLWALPNLVIRVAPQAADYIEERRMLLGLKRDHNSGVYKGQEERRGRTP